MNENQFNFDEYFSRLRLERYYREPIRHHLVERDLFDFDFLGDIRPIEPERDRTRNADLMRTIMEMYSNINVQIIVGGGKKKNLMKERQTKLVPSI